MTQKTVPADADTDFWARLTDKDGVDGTYRVFFILPAVTESTEVVLSYQDAGHLPHLGDIQHPPMPKTKRREVIDGSRTAVPDQILIYFGLGMITGVKIDRHGLGGQDQHIFREIIIKGSLELRIRQSALGLKMRDHALGMDPAVSAGA